MSFLNLHVQLQHIKDFNFHYFFYFLFFILVEEKYIAIYNFEGKNEDCLTLKEGDIVVVTHKDNNGWWKGSLNGKTGLCPGSYLKEVSPEVDFKKSKFLITNRVPYICTLEW